MNKTKKIVNTYPYKIVTMKWRSVLKRISIYFFCVVAIGCITSSILYWEKERPGKITVEKSTEEKEEVIIEETTTQTAENVIKIEESNPKKAQLFIIEEDGYLVIYNQITSERYDNTSIYVKDLPERLQKELESGLYFYNEQELYDFLENYSS